MEEEEEEAEVGVGKVGRRSGKVTVCCFIGTRLNSLKVNTKL